MKNKSNLKLDKKTGHLLEVPTSKEVRDKVRKNRQQDQAVTIHQTKAEKNFDKVQKIIDRMHAKAKLPKILTMIRRKYLSTVCVINKPGKSRSLLSDKPGKYVMLCHGKMAKVFVNNVCLIVKIQQSFHREEDTQDADGHTIPGKEVWQDGSWSIVPCSVDKSYQTTIQEVRLRPWFFLHRYWYEITFNGRIQPGMMFYDYQLNPALVKKHFWVTREYVKVRNQDAENDYFRFWLHKPKDYADRT